MWAKRCYTFGHFIHWHCTHRIRGPKAVILSISSYRHCIVPMETLNSSLKIISNLAMKSINNSLGNLLQYLQFIPNGTKFIGACRDAKKEWYCIIQFLENHENLAFFSSDFYWELYKNQTNKAISKVEKRHWSASISFTTSYFMALL